MPRNQKKSAIAYALLIGSIPLWLAGQVTHSELESVPGLVAGATMEDPHVRHHAHEEAEDVH